MGISPSQMSLLAFALSAALGGVGGIVIAPLTLVSYDMGLMLGLKGFVAAVIGGLTERTGRGGRRAAPGCSGVVGGGPDLLWIQGCRRILGALDRDFRSLGAGIACSTRTRGARR